MVRVVGSIGYKLKCIKNMNLSNMINIVDKIHKKTNIDKHFLIMDMIICSNKYGTGYYDYQEFEFYNLNKTERKTYLTRVKNNAIVKKYKIRNILNILTINVSLIKYLINI